VGKFYQKTGRTKNIAQSVGMKLLRRNGRRNMKQTYYRRKGNKIIAEGKEGNWRGMFT